MSLITDRASLDFLLFDVLSMQALQQSERFSAFDRDTATAILDTAQKIAEDVYLPCAAEVDAQEPEFVDGKAITHPKVGPALKEYCEAGFLAAGFDESFGGMGAPSMLKTAIDGMFSCANTSIQSYAMLTQGAANLINTFGTEQQKSLFLPPMLEGRWLGTMCLSEPQAGSSLADIRTRAEPIGDGRYKITGTKMWISGGEQDISENIVNMVLAKVPDGPPGVKGISLFITPKMRVHDDGSLGDPNNITLAGLNHKLGNRATTNTLLNFGEKGDCIGWLVGQEHHGLAYMFQMMNEARIAVGHGASMLGLAGYLYSLQYAKERPQGRRPSEKDPDSPQIPLIEHADVRRLLLAQKAFTEGAMALIFYCAQLVDEIAIAPSKEEAQRVELLLDLLTPMAKSWPSEYCLEANKHAIQILGGYGYTRDYPVERFYRDNRLNPIHEGAHAIHGIDLLGRKVRVAGGAAFQTFIELVSETLDEAQSHTELAAECAQLSALRDTLIDTTQTLADPGQGERELANATLYLDAFGHITVGWLWLRQGLAALKRQTGGEETPFLSGKLQTMRYFYRYELVKVPPMLGLCKATDDTCLAMTAQQYL